jgi:hypothetical protein
MTMREVFKEVHIAFVCKDGRTVIAMDLKEISCEERKWMELAHARVQWWTYCRY